MALFCLCMLQKKKNLSFWYCTVFKILFVRNNKNDKYVYLQIRMSSRTRLRKDESVTCKIVDVLDLIKYSIYVWLMIISPKIVVITGGIINEYQKVLYSKWTSKILLVWIDFKKVEDFLNMRNGVKYLKSNEDVIIKCHTKFKYAILWIWNCWHLLGVI